MHEVSDVGEQSTAQVLASLADQQSRGTVVDSPIVGKNQKIKIIMTEVPGQNMFWAPLYVGSEHADNYVMYDTMETKIAINAKQA